MGIFGHLIFKQRRLCHWNPLDLLYQGEGLDWEASTAKICARCVNIPGGTRNKLHCTQLQTGVTGPNKLDAEKIGAHHSAWKTQSWELVPDHGRRCSHRLHWTLEFQALMVAGPAKRWVGYQNLPHRITNLIIMIGKKS